MKAAAKKKAKPRARRAVAAKPAEVASPPEDRHERFANEYLIDLNATAAYRRVYGDVTPGAASVAGYRLLRNAKIASRIDELRVEQRSRLHLEQDRPIRALRTMIEADVRMVYDEEGRLLPLTKWPDDLVHAVAGVKIKYFPGTEYSEEHHVLEFKLADRHAATRTMMQHFGMLTEKREISGPNGGPIPHSITNDERVDQAASLLALAQKRMAKAGNGHSS